MSQLDLFAERAAPAPASSVVVGAIYELEDHGRWEVVNTEHDVVLRRPGERTGDSVIARVEELSRSPWCQVSE